jgi:hypothetical protein
VQVDMFSESTQTDLAVTAPALYARQEEGGSAGCEAS